MVSKKISCQVILVALAIILTSLVCSVATKVDFEEVENSTQQSVPLVNLCKYKNNGDYNNIGDQDIFSCARMLLDTVVGACKYLSFIQFHYTNITDVRCKGITCHAEIATTNEMYHAGLDCVQNANSSQTASCTCRIYHKIERD
uniref:Uncharacterized protein n=1 Tax=Cacopsylla melanoneura TaxID=428564 RepID=A0A8D9DYA5_9HEMI